MHKVWAFTPHLPIVDKIRIEYDETVNRGNGLFVDWK